MNHICCFVFFYCYCYLLNHTTTNSGNKCNTFSNFFEHLDELTITSYVCLPSALFFPFETNPILKCKQNTPIKTLLRMKHCGGINQPSCTLPGEFSLNVFLISCTIFDLSLFIKKNAACCFSQIFLH